MKKTIILLSSIFIVFGAAAVSSGADLTADMTISSRGEKDTPGKVYMQGNKMRIEIGEESDEKAVTITRPDKKAVWILMPEEKMYMEQPYQADTRMKAWTSQEEANAKFIGNETVSGIPCKKYQVQGQQAFYWISEKISFPVKTQDPDGSMVLKNIRIGNVSGDLFEVPSGFEKVSMPAMGGMPQGIPGMPTVK